MLAVHLALRLVWFFRISWAIFWWKTKMILTSKETGDADLKEGMTQPITEINERVLIYEEVDETGTPTGREISFSGVEFQPLQYKDLVGKNLTQKIDIPLSWKNSKVVASSDTEMLNKIASGNAILHSRYTCKTIGLVRGGWLPSGIAFHNNMTILPDRCTISELRSQFQNGAKRNEKTDDFVHLFAGRPIRINPLLFVLEGNSKKNPSLDIIEQQFDEACTKIKSALPMAEIVPAGRGGLQGVAGIIQDSKLSMERKQEFLIKLAPLLNNPVSSDRRNQLWDRTLDLVNICGVQKDSLVVFAALSSIMVPLGKSPAKRILKPTANYSAGDAYNALADLRSLEVLLNIFATFPTEQVMLCTGDKNLALLWAGIRASNFTRSDTGLGSFNLSPVEELWPGVTQEQLVSFFNS